METKEEGNRTHGVVLACVELEVQGAKMLLLQQLLLYGEEAMLLVAGGTLGQCLGPMISFFS